MILEGIVSQSTPRNGEGKKGEKSDGFLGILKNGPLLLLCKFVGVGLRWGTK